MKNLIRLWRAWRLFRSQQQLIRRLRAQADGQRARIIKVGQVLPTYGPGGRIDAIETLGWEFEQTPWILPIGLDDKIRIRVYGYTGEELLEISRRRSEFELTVLE